MGCFSSIGLVWGHYIQSSRVDRGEGFMGLGSIMVL